MVAYNTLCYINYIYMKKMYKLLIIYDEKVDECETVVEYFDEIEEDTDILSIEEYADKDIRNELKKSNLMGEAWDIIQLIK